MTNVPPPPPPPPPSNGNGHLVPMSRPPPFTNGEDRGATAGGPPRQAQVATPGRILVSGPPRSGDDGAIQQMERMSLTATPYHMSQYPQPPQQMKNHVNNPPISNAMHQPVWNPHGMQTWNVHPAMPQQTHPPMHASLPQQTHTLQPPPMHSRPMSYPQPVPPQTLQRHFQEKQKIDPSQIPRIPLFTRPHQAPSTIYPPTSTPGTSVTSSFSTMPPPADSRYVYSHSMNANPRIMRSTVATFPVDGNTQRKVGVPLGLVVTPFAGLTELCDTTNHNDMGDIYSQLPKYVDYIPHESFSDPERIPVLRNHASPITPPRCHRCHAYLNPFCTALPATHYRGGYAPVQKYNCNFCSTKNSISIPDEYIADGLVEKATRFSTVEYEVGGPYVVRSPVENVRLYGVEYTPEFGLGNGHHGSMRSFGWRETLDALKDVISALREVTPNESSVKVGMFAYCQDMLVFPYRKIKSKRHGDENGVDEKPEIGVSIVADVKEDPFCPLPLHAWTYDVSKNDMDWRYFCHVMDSMTDIMEMLTSDYEKKENEWDRNCGGAALAALVDALKDSGGRATLITTRRPNYGVGALRDREAGQQSQYMNAEREKRLFTPLQHLTFTATAMKAEEEMDRQASLFYKQLGEDCTKFRASLDIVVTSSLLKAPSSNAGPGSTNLNSREFLDVATLSELCRVSCGKFKWLRVGNECGIAVDEKGGCNANVSFTKEQLQEELKRSAWAYMGSDAVFKLRCSNGVQVKSYSPILPVGTLVGDGIVDSAELELPSIDSSTTIALLLEHKIGGVMNTMDSGKQTNPMVFFQSAVLYTTLTGRRRVRVTTLGLPTTKVAADVFRSADLGAAATIMTRQSVSDVNLSDDGLKSTRYNVFDLCVSILANYRLHTNARSSSSGQLILPESLQLLPLFCLSLRKSRMFRHSLQTNTPSVKPFPTADERAYHIFYASMVSPNIALQCIHPNVFEVSDMRNRDGDWITPPILESNKLLEEEVTAASMRPVCQLPKSTNPSMTCLDETGMYILDDRFALYLFVGKDVTEQKWREFIHVEPKMDGKENRGGVPVGSLSLASTNSGNKLRSILRQLRVMNAPNPTIALNSRPTHAPLILVFVGRGSVFEEEMDSLLVDDPDMHEKSYVDFLCTLHKAIRDKNANTQ